jgi:hypothetical protein
VLEGEPMARSLKELSRDLDRKLKRGLEDIRRLLPSGRGGKPFKKEPIIAPPRTWSPTPLRSRTVSPESFAPSPIRWTPTPSFRQETPQEVRTVTPAEIIREVVNNPLIEITPEMLPIINDVAILMDSNGDLLENEFAEQFRRDKIIPRKKRKKSKYQLELGKQLKMLKKKHPRTPITRLMKRAHRLTKKALK